LAYQLSLKEFLKYYQNLLAAADEMVRQAHH